MLRPNGFVFAAAVSRFASLLSGFTYGFLSDPVFVDIIKRDLTDGQHRNPVGSPFYFTTAFFIIRMSLKARWRRLALQLPPSWRSKGR